MPLRSLRTGGGEKAYTRDAAVYLDLDDLALNDLALLRYPHANGLPESLGQGLGLGHLQGKDFRGGEHSEGDIRTQRLSHAHSDGSLASTGGTSDQDGAASNLAILNHLQYDSSSLAGLLLADEALRRGLGLEGVGLDTEAADVRVSGDEVEAAELFALGDGGDGLQRRSAWGRAGMGRVRDSRQPWWAVGNGSGWEWRLECLLCCW